MRWLLSIVVGLLGTAGLAGCNSGCEELETELRLAKEQARELAVATGCSAVEQCDALPMGVRACGGPEQYVVFCRDTTDVAALESKLVAIDRSQYSFNQGCRIFSDCMLVPRPDLVLVDGRCEPQR